MTKEKTPSKKTAKLIADIASNDERKIIAALKRVPHDGDSSVVKPMLELLATNPSNDVKLLLEKSLYNLKDPECIHPLVGGLKDEQLQEIRAEILTCIWQSGLDVSDEVEYLVSVAIGGDFMTAVEVMTILDNLEGFPDELLTNSIKLLDKTLERNHENAKLLGNIRQILLEKLLD